jgi:hypothetical protein
MSKAAAKAKADDKTEAAPGAEAEMDDDEEI